MDVNCELNHVRQELDNKAKEYAILSSKIAIRRIELNAAGVSSKSKNTPDELLRGMIERCNVLIVEIRDLKKRKRELIEQVPPKPKKPRGERPGNRVYMGPGVLRLQRLRAAAGAADGDGDRPEAV